jgi:hypothetical protein
VTPREIYQTSLRLFNGDKYDKVTSQFELNEKYPQYGRCFYHEFYLIFSIKGDLIYINTNIISSRQFELENGRKWNYSEVFKGIDYESNLLNVIRHIRNNRIDYVIQNEF